jgi:hypothetical protein
MIECIISFILPMLYLPDAKLGKVCRSLNSEIWAFVTARQQTQRRDQPRNEGRRSEIRNEAGVPERTDPPEFAACIDSLKLGYAISQVPEKPLQRLRRYSLSISTPESCFALLPNLIRAPRRDTFTSAFCGETACFGSLGCRPR